jgi:hypothetical protein
VRTLPKLPLQHVDYLILILFVNALEVLLIVYYILLVDYPTVNLESLLQLGYTLLEDVFKATPDDDSRKVNNLLPRKRYSLLPAGTILLQQEDNWFEDASMEDGDGLPTDEYLFTLLRLGWIVLVGEEVLPIDEGLVGDQWIVLIIGNLEIPQEFQVL